MAAGAGIGKVTRDFGFRDFRVVLLCGQHGWSDEFYVARQ
jgi:hypothetical protein